jgi:hypothetical protein
VRAEPTVATGCRVNNSGGLKNPEFAGLAGGILVYFAIGEAERLASRVRSLLRVSAESQGIVKFTASRGSHRKAVHKHATLPLCPILATIVLSLALAALAAKALLPDLSYDELASLASADPGNATTDDGDDDGKPVPQTDSACKFGDFAKAILVTVDFALPHSLMPVHALAVTDAAITPLLPDHFLPNAETGPPARIALGATTVSRAAWLLGSVGTVRRSGRFPHAYLSHPQQQPTIVFAENGTTPHSFPRRSSL